MEADETRVILEASLRASGQRVLADPDEADEAFRAGVCRVEGIPMVENGPHDMGWNHPSAEWDGLIYSAPADWRRP